MESKTDTIIPFSKLRKIIAERLSYSKQHIPHFYLQLDVDMEVALSFRKAYNEQKQIHVSINDLIIKAAANALCKFERMNSHVTENQIIIKNEVNIGIAVSVEDGIFVPVVPDADKKTLDEISETAKKVTAKAKRGVIDMRVAGTFTISNLGMCGVKNFSAIINPPECAILAVGGIEKQIIYNKEKKISEARSIMNLSLACDHRAVDGVYSAGFLNAIKEFLEQPEQLGTGTL